MYAEYRSHRYRLPNGRVHYFTFTAKIESATVDDLLNDMQARGCEILSVETMPQVFCSGMNSYKVVENRVANTYKQAGTNSVYQLNAKKGKNLEENTCKT